MSQSKKQKSCITGALFIALMISLLALSAGAQSDAGSASADSPSGNEPDTAFVPDPEGARDTLYCDIRTLGKDKWAVDVSYFTDVDVFAASVPLKFTSGLRRVVVDSTSFKGAATEKFAHKSARPDAEIQCLTLGFISAFSPSGKPLKQGKGRFATVYLHAEGPGASQPLTVDTTTTYPENSLMYVKQDWKLNKQTKIFPAYVVTSDEKVKD